RRRVANAVGDCGGVPREARAQGPLAVTGGIPDGAESGAEGAVSCHQRAGTVHTVVLVPAQAKIEGQTWIEAPIVVDEQRMRDELGTEAVRENRIVLKQRRRAGQPLGKDVGAANNRGRAEDAVVAARLVIVRLADVVETVVARDDAVRPEVLGR